MKRFKMGIIVCVLLAFSVVGCEEDLTPLRLQQLAAHQDVLQQQADTLQATATQLTEQLAAGGIVDPNAVAKVAKINVEADKVLAQIAVIAKALEGVPLTGDDAQDFISQLQAANAASSGFNPYVIPVGSGLTLLSMVLAWFAKRKADEAAANKLKYQAHKQGVERTMKEVSASTNALVKAVETNLYDNIGEARASLGV